MARPAEKARSMLNKWVAMREAGSADRSAPRRPTSRPPLASECQHLADAERFRGQIVREITVLLEKLQNPAAAVADIQEWNDQVNRKMREKYHWNKRIYQLGGLDYNALERQRQIEQGVQDGSSNSSYKYYGVAKDLPGVKEYLQQQQQKQTAPNKIQHYYHLTPDYYGWRDEEDGVLLEMEQEAFDKLRASAADPSADHDSADAEERSRKKPRREESDAVNSTIPQEGIATTQLDEKKTPVHWAPQYNYYDEDRRNDYLDGIPDPETVSKLLLQKRKEALMKKLMGL